MTPLTLRTTLPFSLLALAAITLPGPGCAGDGEPSGPIVAPRDDVPADAHDLGEFVAHLDPKNRTFTISRVPSKASKGGAAGAPGATPQSLDEITIDVDNVAGTGAVSTVELVTNSVGSNASCPTGFQSNSFCGNVTVRSFYASRPISNVYLQVSKISVSGTGVDVGTTHGGLNSDAPFSTLSNTFGLWKFTGTGVTSPGVLADNSGTNGGANAGSRDLVFADPDGASTDIYMHVYATLTYSGYSMGALTAGIPFTNNACTQGGAVLLNQGGGIALTTTLLPFPFTFYSTLYLPRTASKVTLGRWGQMGMGTQAGTSGVNVGLPTTSAAAFKPGIFPFWENLNYTTNNATVLASPSALCALTIGATPNRMLMLTWHDMKFTGDTSAVYPLTPNITFSVRLHEGSDIVDFVYGTMLNPTVSRANGATANVGVQDGTGLVGTTKTPAAGNVASNSTITMTPLP